MGITDWPITERPREKLIQQGAKALSDAELLAIFLRTGCAGKSAVDLARDLLTQFDGLRPILEADHTQFCRAKGLGDAKYSQLQAVLEMARRHLAEQLQKSQTFESSQTVKQYLVSQLRHQKREVFAVLFLDNQHQLICYEELSQGTVNTAAVYPRELVKTALKHNASALIIAHNHPSGIAEPSMADKQITEEIRQCLKIMAIEVLDHIVVGEGEVVSFAERGWL